MASDLEIKRWQTLVGASADGRPGPRTYEATVAWFANREYLERDSKPAASIDAAMIPEPRARVVAIALGELGPGGLAKEQDPDKYWRDVCPALVRHPGKISWCGGFALWCLRQAGLTSRMWTPGQGFAYGYLRTVSLPEPGDIAYFGKPNHHYAIVRRVSGGRVYTVDGNTLSAPREGVTAKDYPLNAVDVGGGCYFSIATLLA